MGTTIKKVNAKARRVGSEDYDLTTNMEEIFEFHPAETIKTLYVQAEYSAMNGTGVDITILTSLSSTFTSKTAIEGTGIDWDTGDGAAVVVEEAIDLSGTSTQWFKVTTTKTSLTAGTLNLWFKAVYV